MSEEALALGYLVAAVCFTLGLKGLSSPKMAPWGNWISIVGMVLSIGLTLMSPEIVSYKTAFVGLVCGGLIGGWVALRITMKSMPELVAALHSFVGLAAVLVAIAVFDIYPVKLALVIEASAGVAIGAVTFTGSVVAFLKLRGWVSSAPLDFPGQHLLNLVLFVFVVATGFLLGATEDSIWLWINAGVAFVLGTLLVLPIGGADMPVVVSLLNSYSGWAATATGFTLGNPLLIATGALVGASGAILSYIMCKAMNRSIINVVFGGFGADVEGAPSTLAKASEKGIRSMAPLDAAFLLKNAQSVLMIPGYGMAVGQAQHAVKDLYEGLLAEGVEVGFAIHPVAGRMPGHMNVLLAEADVPYDHVYEMEEINSQFSQTDVALVIGANDIVNPDAEKDKASPLYGMPILQAHKARQVLILKRSLKPGYAGVDNSLFSYNNAALVFGDARTTCENLVKALADV